MVISLIECNLYTVPYEYARAMVWVKLKGDTLFKERWHKIIAKHKLIQ